MLTYNELVAKKNDLLNKKTILEDECKRWFSAAATPV